MQTRTSESRREVVQDLIPVGLVFSISCAFLDSSIGLLTGPAGLASFNMFVAAIAAALGVLFCGYMLLTSLVCCSLKYLWNLRAFPVALSMAVFLGILFLLMLIGNFDLFPFSINNLFKVVLLAFLCICCGILAYFASKSFSAGQGQNLFIAAIIALPLVLAETCLFIWLHKYQLGSFFSFSSVLATSAYFVIVAFTLVFTWRRANSVKILKFLVILTSVVLVSPLLAWLTAPGQPQLPKSGTAQHKIKHVILITIDTLRADMLSSYSSEGVSTPHIDQLANDGILFKKAVSAAPWTLPAVASLMTGVSPRIHNTLKPESMLPDRLQTLAEYMDKAGYTTGAIVRNPFLAPEHNLSQGFMEYNLILKPMHSSIGTQLLAPVFPAKFDPSTSELSDLAIDWIRSNGSQDFFFWVHYLNPHVPYSPPAAFLPEKLLPQIGPTVPHEMISKIRGGLFVPTEEEKRWIKTLYEAEVKYVDDNIGRLINALKEANLYDESVIVVTSDHGEEFWEHGTVEHGHSLYNEVIDVPLIIKLPSSSSTGVVKEPVSVASLMPTLLELCGIDFVQDSFSFSSLTPFWNGNSGGFKNQPIISTGVLYYEKQEGVTFGKFKYIRSLASNQGELYDLEQDPAEQVSLVASAPDKVEEARNILRKHKELVAKLRQIHGLEGSEQEIVLDKAREQMKALGYIE